jgi:phosphoribosyl-ATP pyrophosphohydrolase
LSGNKLTIEELLAVVASRRGGDVATSYTAKLLDGGVEKCAKKFGEEAVETVIAAVSGDRAALRAEAADMLYHFAVLLVAAGVELDEVYDELGRRQGVSGHDEKASRTS